MIEQYPKQTMQHGSETQSSLFIKLSTGKLGETEKFNLTQLKIQLIL